MYLDEWEKCVKERPGFEKNEKKRMLLSDETLLGLRMTGDFISNQFTLSTILSLCSQLICRACKAHLFIT